MQTKNNFIKTVGIKFGILTVSLILSLFLFYDSTMNSKEEVQQSTNQLLISIKELLDMLNNENVFLIDINKLKEIELYRSIKELEINFYKYFEPNYVLSCGCFSHQLDSFLLKVRINIIDLYLYNIDFNSYIFK
jgi:hypothetical protein